MLFRFTTSLVLVAILLFGIGACSKGGGATSPVVDMSGVDNDRYAAAGQGIVVKAAYNTVKIKRGMDISGFAEKLTIRSARNEYEAFQVIPLPEAGTILTGVEVEVSDLYGPSGEFFSRGNFTYFLEAYIHVTSPSDTGGDTGWFPDPLVPISNPFGVDMSVGVQPVWIKCFVPKNTAPVVYSGTVNVTASGGLSRSIPLKLRVLNFTLNDEPSLKTAFGINREVINTYHGFPPGDEGPEVKAMRDEYAEMLLDHRVSFWGFDWFKPWYEVNPDNSVSVDFSNVAQNMQDYLGGSKYTMTSFQFPLRMWDLTDGRLAAGVTVGDNAWRARVKSYISEVSKYFDGLGILDKTYIFIIDEPNDATAYEDVRYLGQLIHEVPQPCAKFLVTEQPYSWDYQNWGTLLGYVDIFCPIIYLVEPGQTYDPNDPYFDNTFEYDTWVYTNTNMWPRPGFAIDHPAVEPRLMAWLCYQQGIQGWLYWSTNYWRLANPWDDPYTFGDPAAGAGCGVFLYPGMYISAHTDQQDIDGPIPSIRLEEIREGLEDYEYLMRQADGVYIPQLETIINGYTEFVTDGEAFYQFRNIGTNLMFGAE